ncbi:c-type cytochrome [Ferruginibacter paludis]|jgi:cytochrome c|uniref:c-type cytochrome n=1 Tax=Ferruginibacter paludis TaxID=1310417 RepID=UPI0025B4C207|nr:c-type cytochrome [Ferruginibacter paludis]MDN3659115.1 c-type cytochrome [Ferruginibacter paludis]
MKKIITICLLTAGFYACNNGGGTETKTTTATTEPAADTKTTAKTDVTDSPDFVKGLELVNNNDCKTCHKVDEKLIGPAFRDVANKYPNNPSTLDTLAHKIIKGGQGNWGSIPMAAHDKLSVEDATAMAKYVLLLKNN